MQSASTGSRHQTPSRFGHSYGSLKLYEPLQLEYNFEEHFRHLPPTLYNRYLKSHRFLTRGKRLAPSPLCWNGRPEAKDCVAPPYVPIGRSGSRTRSSRYADESRRRLTTGDDWNAYGHAHSRYPSPMAVHGYADGRASEQIHTGSRRTSVRFPSTYSARFDPFDSAIKSDAKQGKIQNALPLAGNSPRASSTHDVLDSPRPFVDTSTDQTPLNRSKRANQTELIKTLGECIQVVYEQLQQMSDQSTDQCGANMKASLSAPTLATCGANDLEQQVQKLQDITEKLKQSTAQLQATPSVWERPTVNALTQEISPELPKNKYAHQGSEDAQMECTQEWTDGSLGQVGADRAQTSEHRETGQVEQRATMQATNVLGSDIDAKEQEEASQASGCESDTDSGSMGGATNRGKGSNRKQMMRRQKGRRTSVKRKRRRKGRHCTLIEAKHLVDLLVYNQLVDQLQKFYGYASNEQLNMIADQEGNELKSIVNHNHCLLADLKNKLTAKLNIIHYRIYQKMHRKLKKTPTSQADAEDKQVDADCVTKLIAGGLDKQIKNQSKYTVLMELMDDSTFQRFLMDKVKYFLRKIRSDRLRKLEAKHHKTIDMDLQHTGEMDTEEHDHAVADAHECRADTPEVDLNNNVIDKMNEMGLPRSTSQLTMDSGIGSMPTSPTSRLLSPFADDHLSTTQWSPRDRDSASTSGSSSSRRPQVSLEDKNIRFFCAMFTAVIFLIALTSMHNSSHSSGSDSSSGSASSRPLPSTLTARRPAHMSCADWILLEAETLFNWPSG